MKYRYAQRRNEGRGRFSEKKEEESTVKHSNLSVSVRGVAQPDVSDGPLRKSCQVNDKAKKTQRCKLRYRAQTGVTGGRRM